MLWSDLELPRLPGVENTLVLLTSWKFWDTKGTERRQGTLFPKEQEFLTALLSASAGRWALSRLLGPRVVVALLVIGEDPAWSPSATSNDLLFYPPESSATHSFKAECKDNLLYEGFSYPPGRMFCWLLGFNSIVDFLKRRSKAYTSWNYSKGRLKINIRFFFQIWHCKKWRLTMLGFPAHSGADPVSCNHCLVMRVQAQL